MSEQRRLTLNADAPAADVSRGSVQFIGTATVLIRYAGLTILTDPNFIHRHEKVDIGNGIHATRQTDPAMEIGELPPLDLVVLSHLHGDHFDRVAEHELDRSVPIVTTPDATRELRKRGFGEVHPLSRWSQLSVRKGGSELKITALPGRHGPALVSFAMPEVMGSMLEFPSADGAAYFSIYISGDTLAMDDLREIARSYPEIDLSLLHLGGTRILGILVTMDGEEGLEAMRMVKSRQTIPIHYDDYDVFKSPLSDFQQRVAEAGLEDQVHYLARGETYTFAGRRVAGSRPFG
jgi:L-ascorbate metabolism protein UlaG (beta-lactamase superfamily)